MKKIGATPDFQPGAKQIHSLLPAHPTRGENTPAKIRGINTATRKKTPRMQLQDIKTMRPDFINKRSKMLNLKTFKIYLWSKILKQTTRYSYKRSHDFEEYCVWKGQATKEELSKNGSAFLVLKQFIERMMNQEMSREVGCLNSLLSRFFIYKMFYFQFLLLLK